MAIGWINYLSVVAGSLNVIMLFIITSIVLKRNLKEKLNWLFGVSFFFIATAYVLLPLGAFVYDQADPTAMLLFTKLYAASLFIGLVMMMVSSIAINYGTKFAIQWAIIIPAFLVIGLIVGLLFGLHNTESNWYSIKAVEGSESADTQTSLFFTLIFYPICLIIIGLILYFFIKAYRATNDYFVRRCLKFFLTGFGFCVTSLIPNILSNVLANYWENAQILNAVEFIMVSIGVAFLLTGFLTRSNNIHKTEIQNISID
ncbi:MAG: hypothetical protein FK734_00390 [Asgard group archaeon]|nr:hypothetical protein [Asgard group archaeon]